MIFLSLESKWHGRKKHLWEILLQELSLLCFDMKNNIKDKTLLLKWDDLYFIIQTLPLITSTHLVYSLARTDVGTLAPFIDGRCSLQLIYRKYYEMIFWDILYLKFFVVDYDVNWCRNSAICLFCEQNGCYLICMTLSRWHRHLNVVMLIIWIIGNLA
jgi:hypothetical protein